MVMQSLPREKNEAGQSEPLALDTLSTLHEADVISAIAAVKADAQSRLSVLNAVLRWLRRKPDAAANIDDH